MHKFSLTISNQSATGAPVLLNGAVSDCIARAKQIGYDAVEMHYAHPSLIDMDAAVKALTETNLTVSGIATGLTYVVHRLSLTDEDAGVRKAAVLRINEYTDVAAKLGGAVIIGCVRGNIPDGADQGHYLVRLKSAMLEITRYAALKGVTIVLEAINRYENNFLNTAMETIDLIESVDMPNLKLLLDTFHMNIEEKDFCVAIRSSREHLGYIHVADSNRMYPGGGHIDYRSIMDELNNIRYCGAISAECLPLPDRITAAAAWLANLKSI